jgi:pyruvate dehydrogenase E1 component subunit beta
MQMTMIEALNSALALEMERDQRVILLGQDIGKNGGVFRVTEHLQQKFGEERVFDTPLSESGIIGSSVGMAIYGLRPIAEIQFAGFLFLCMNQLVSQAARIRFRSAGAYTCPLVVRAPYGGGVRTPELHSDSLEGVFLQTPGLKVVIPSNPYDAKGLLASAVADPDPVLFLENIKLYRSFRQETPEEHYSIPLGKAKTVQEGTEVSVFAYGAMVNGALEAAKLAQQEMGTSVEIIDLRTAWPLDEQAIVNSVEKTGRAIVVHEAPRAGGIGAEVTAIINEHCLYSLLKPVERVTGYDTPYPVPGLEDYYLPTPAKVLTALRRAMEP